MTSADQELKSISIFMCWMFGPSVFFLACRLSVVVYERQNETMNKMAEFVSFGLSG